MRPYFHLFRQEQPYVSHQTPQKVLILVLAQWYSNCYMSPELANKYIWWQVGRFPFSFTEYHESKVCQALTYIQHRHMVCGKLHICHDLVLDQNVNYNAYSTLFIHEVLDVDHKIVMLGIVWYHNTFSHICVQYHNYPEHDTICLSIFFYWIFSYILPDRWLHVYKFSLDMFFWDFFPDFKSVVCKNALEYVNQIFLILEVEHYTLMYIYIAFVNFINTINHIFAMTKCTYTSINYNGVTLGQNWHRVYCWNTTTLLCTNISIFPYFN